MNDRIPFERFGDVDAVLHALRATSRMPTVMLAAVDGQTWRVRAVLDEAKLGIRSADDEIGRTTYCDLVCQTGKPLAVENAAVDARFAEHAAHRVAGRVSYIGVPLRSLEGETVGTLCAIDRQPHVGLDGALPVFELLARSLMRNAEEAETAASRERFLATVAHDLRNPLSAIGMSARSLARDAGQAELVVSHAQRISRASDRMDRLIGDVLDMVRGRMGNSIALVRDHVIDVSQLLRGVVDETASAFPSVEVRADVDLQGVGARWDADRIAQCLGNLLRNACTHGTPGEPVIVHVDTSDTMVTILLRNAGRMRTALGPTFLPFVRRDGGPGLGLGLYIADRIAEAHGGSLEIASEGESTTARLVLPRCDEPTRIRTGKRLALRRGDPNDVASADVAEEGRTRQRG